MDILYAIFIGWLILFIGFWLWFYVTLWPEIKERAYTEAAEMMERRKASDEEYKRRLEQELIAERERNNV